MRTREETVNPEERKVAYFSMEIGIHPHIPTYAGGLGILAGDTIKSAADLKVPLVAVTLLHREGYLHQTLDAEGRQHDAPQPWDVPSFLSPTHTMVTVPLEGRDVRVTAWTFLVKGVSGYVVPIIFLDTNLQKNREFARSLTGRLYGGDERYRLAQEIILGIGGVLMLQKLGYTNLSKYHMNEGHASLLTVALFRLFQDIEEVRKRCVFTTHTPVPAGHDHFPLDLVRKLIDFPFDEEDMPAIFNDDKSLNMTRLGIHFSGYVNGVAKKHRDVSREMFPGYFIDAITNGVHSVTWTSEPFAELFDRYIPGWRTDPFMLRYALNIPRHDILHAHQKAKKHLFDIIRSHTHVSLDEHVFTIGFARRATPYKRAHLLLYDISKLEAIAARGRLQLIYAGKAHPRDSGGKDIIQQIFAAQKKLSEHVRLVYLPNYDMELAKHIIAGVDLWLNTPLRPMEASGTSGMKAAHNGVPSLSVLDGWWIEGCIEGVTGWSIGPLPSGTAPLNDDARDADALYEKLEKTIVPLYYHHRDKWIDVCRHAIAINASFFNTHRMVLEYVAKSYFV